MSRVRFPDILFQLLSQGLDAVYWSPCGTAVVLVDGPELFAILAPYVRTRYFRSVTRQMNMYGFEKVLCRKECHHQYSHPSFRREAPHLLPEVRRHSLSAGGEDKTHERLVQLRSVIERQLMRIRELEARMFALEGEAAAAAAATSAYAKDNVDYLLYDARQEALDAQLCKSMPPDVRVWEEALNCAAQ